MTGILIRRMTLGDIDGATELRRLAGWNQTHADWRRQLDLEPEGCFVVCENGEVVGTVTTTRHGSALGWIGMMLVHPDHRSRGIGRKLMEQALAYLRARGIRCVKLDATPAGKPLYESLGFLDECRLTRWRRPERARRVGIEDAADAGIRTLERRDLRAVEALDLKAFGAGRLSLLKHMYILARAKLVWTDGVSGEVTGWGLLRPGEQADYLGPLICGSQQGVAALVRALLRAAEMRPVIWDIFDENGPAIDLARQFGFAPERPLTRMYCGEPMSIGDISAQFAIADPAVG
jgi:predicted N-acetyltransferase YhbS